MAFKRAPFLLVLNALIIGCTTTHQTTQTTTTHHQALNQTELRASILAETQVGGKLDFFSSIKGHEYDGTQIKPGLYTTLGHIALYKWGKSVHEQGVADLEEAYAIFAEFKGREISSRDKDYIKSGFTNEYDK
ncbi:hypothetical protein [Hymenobacter fodinae]|uniref:Uncharacterized protein n=1 Tax=Hymenobacter fodinae TaxID=2510796 RepID=A0A4Z0P306_9BACT|nr:hypothetical protein [Hymenobacter fodinae]TGE06035.1 hypothetical protein EU556_14295 [Hymenobacter fodinae]